MNNNNKKWERKLEALKRHSFQKMENKHSKDSRVYDISKNIQDP